jgi:hypothetical protein
MKEELLEEGENLQRLGHLPINECYFAGAEHAGIAAGKGCIVILHVPTGDVWNLTAFGGRDLFLDRIINGQKVPARLEEQVRSLYAQAALNCGGVLNPVHLGSRIVSKCSCHSISEPLEALSLHPPTALPRPLIQSATQ